MEASKFTEVGYVGRDVESMVRDLVEQSVHLVRMEKKEAVKEQAARHVEEIILEAIIPAMKSPGAVGSGNGSEADARLTDGELNERTRERFREKIRTGELDHRKIEIDVQQAAMPNIGVMGGPIDDSSMMNIQEMISGMMPRQRKKRKATVGEAKRILLEEEAAKLIDMDEVKEEAIRRARNLGIILSLIHI